MPIGIDAFAARRHAAVPLDGSPELAAQAVHPPTTAAPESPHDTLKQLESWYLEQVDAHAQNRREQILDADFYDHDQWDPESVAVLAERNQAALVFNLIKPTVDWLIGTERRTRIDWKVHPRGPEDEALAQAKSKTLKFVADVNEAGFERSRQFADAVKVGVGWVREFAQADADPLPVGVTHIDWKMVRWDPYGRKDDLSDCRSLTLERYVDLDWALALYPAQADALRAAAVNALDPQLELLEDDLALPGLFWGSRPTPGAASLNGSLRLARSCRSRVKLIETEYRRLVRERRLRVLVDDYEALRGAPYDPADGAVNDLLLERKLALDDKPVDRVWRAVWTSGVLCENAPVPYRHGRFSVTPLWAYRRHRDGLPYGVIRGLRDPQEEYNKRRSKALFAASTNRIIYEKDAIAAEDEDGVLAEAAKPNGQIRLAKDALMQGRFRIDAQVEVTAGHVQLMEQSRQHINEGSGVTRENLGLESGAQSGRAIIAKQQQGAVTTAEIFDNYRRAIQQSGRKTLSLTEQYLTQPMQIRIADGVGAQWLAINAPSVDPLTGEVIWANDLTASEADFVVDQQDYRETTRMAMAETLFETIRTLPPPLQLQLLDLAIDLTDLPNRAEIVARLREINGVARDGAATPQHQQAADAQAQQAQQHEAQLAQAEREARVAKDRASAEKLLAQAQDTRLATKASALDLAALLQHALPLAPAADRLAAPPGAPT